MYEGTKFLEPKIPRELYVYDVIPKVSQIIKSLSYYIYSRINDFVITQLKLTLNLK